MLSPAQTFLHSVLPASFVVIPLGPLAREYLWVTHNFYAGRGPEDRQPAMQKLNLGPQYGSK